MAVSYTCIVERIARTDTLGTVDVNIGALLTASPDDSSDEFFTDSLPDLSTVRFDTELSSSFSSYAPTTAHCVPTLPDHELWWYASGPIEKECQMTDERSALEPAGQ